MKKLLLLISIIVALANAEENAIKVSQLPFNEAEMLTNYVSYKDINLHARVINPQEEKNFFQLEFSEDKYTAVLVTITNNSNKKIIVNSTQADMQGVKKIKPQTLLNKYQTKSSHVGHTIHAIASLGASSVEKSVEDQKYRAELKRIFNKNSLYTDMLYPDSTIIGCLYFDKKTFDKSKPLEIPVQIMNSITTHNITVEIN